MGEPNIETESTVVFFVNGKKVVDSEVDPEWTLLYYLRNKCLTGTKLGCAEGGCGACTVMISKYDRKNHKVNHLAVNACLTPICAVHGSAVTTVEGIGSTKTTLHPVQERIAKSHGSQCGFCTPGIVMSMYALLRTKPKPKMSDLEIAFQGNLCRCTGYRPIIEGFRSFTEEWEQTRALQNLEGRNGGVCSKGENCCRNEKNVKERDADEILFDTNEFTPYDSSQEPIFPPELLLTSKLDEQFLMIKGERSTWYRPTNFEELLALKSKFPHAKIINGNTEIGVEIKFKNFVYPVMIQPNLIDEMNRIEYTDKGIKFGASVTLNEFQDCLRNEVSAKPEHQTRIFKAIVEILHWFAGKQIRNVAAVGGNIMTGSPISDLNPIFMAASVELHLRNDESSRIVPMDHTFFTGYRRNVVKPDEILHAILIPYTKQDQYFNAYKQAKRKDDDIAIVNCAVNVEFQPGTDVIRDFSIAFGGMAPTTVLSLKTKAKVIGMKWNEQMLEEAYSTLIEDLPLSPGAPGGMIQYRRSLTLSLFFKFYLFVLEELRKNLGNVSEIPKKLKSASKDIHPDELKSSQYFQVVPKDQPPFDAVGRTITHASAYKQATGEAIYCDDMPRFENELYMTLVTSTRAHAKILNIDPSKALAMPGVRAFFCHKDMDVEKNETGPIFHDEKIFYYDEVTSQGQVIGALIADNQMISQRAAKLVKIEYEDLSPIIITIEDAIKEKSFTGNTLKRIVRGDVNKAFETADHVITGEIKMGGQEHFYLETHCCIAVPKEEDEIEIFTSNQHAAETQKLVAHMLGVPFNRVIVRVKRLGGGFGGKESRANVVALPAAFAASRLRRPIRCMLDRDEDMLISGGRHPFMAAYKAGFTKEGKITAVKMDIYNNVGYSLDLSPSVLDRAIFHYENSYFIPNCDITGYMCKTNLPSNTAFRGFGGPQGMFFGEIIAEQIASVLNKPTEEIQALNLYKEGDVTHYNQTLTYCTLQKCWNECMQRSDFHARRKEIEEFNRRHRYKKRGLSIVPTKFGVAFTELCLNQSGALIHVYTDGSVLLSHGGVEMGQGLHTKMVQVASRVLGIPTCDVYVGETSTDKVPNTAATAASSGSDLNGMAVMDACQKIAERLEPYRKMNPKGTWKEWVATAYRDRVSLSATGFYKTPDIGYSYKDNIGQAFNYFTYGVAASVVEIDCLSGDHKVLRTDIVMDLGESLNPAIDIGQVEGAFVQGYGLFTLEELVYSPTGVMYTRGPGMYKIPGFADIPSEFNVSLLRGAPNPRAVYSSKEAISEKIARAMFATGFPLHFIEHPLWIDVYKSLRPTYQPPTSIELTTKFLTLEYEKMFQVVNKELANSSELHLVIEQSSSKDIFKFIILNPNPIFIKCINLRNEFDYLRDETEKIILDYTPEKFMVLISNSVTVLQEVFDELSVKYKHLVPLTCLANMLNLLCKEILTYSSVKTFMDEVVHVISEIRQNSVLSESIKESGADLTVPIKNDWKSYLESLEHLLKNKAFLPQLAIVDSSFNNMDETSRRFWLKIEQLIDVLSPIITLLTELEANTPKIYNLIDYFSIFEENFKKGLKDSFLSDLDKNTVLCSFEEKQKTSIGSIHLAAALLNPATRGSNLTEMQALDALEFIDKVAESVNGIDSKSVMDEVGNYRCQTNNWSKPFLWKCASTMLPLVWWKGICSHSPLSKIATRLLSAPVTSLPMEKTSSFVGDAEINDISTKMMFISENWKLSNHFDDNGQTRSEEILPDQTSGQELSSENDSAYKNDAQDVDVEYVYEYLDDSGEESFKKEITYQ